MYDYLPINKALAWLEPLLVPCESSCNTLELMSVTYVVITAFSVAQTRRDSRNPDAKMRRAHELKADRRRALRPGQGDGLLGPGTARLWRQGLPLRQQDPCGPEPGTFRHQEPVVGPPRRDRRRGGAQESRVRHRPASRRARSRARGRRTSPTTGTGSGSAPGWTTSGLHDLRQQLRVAGTCAGRRPHDDRQASRPQEDPDHRTLRSPCARLS